MSEINKDDLIKRMDGAISAFNGDLSGLRTGRASTTMVDGILVDAYGQKMPIDQIGSISIPEARMISIQVWDKGLVIAVEKAIHESGLGFNPQVDGELIRIPIPELNEERREELSKIAGKYAEQDSFIIKKLELVELMALTSGEAPLTSESQGKCRLRLVGDGKEMDVPFSDAEQALSLIHI